MQKAFPVKGYTIQELNAKIAERKNVGRRKGIINTEKQNP